MLWGDQEPRERLRFAIAAPGPAHDRLTAREAAAGSFERYAANMDATPCGGEVCYGVTSGVWRESCASKRHRR